MLSGVLIGLVAAVAAPQATSSEPVWDIEIGDARCFATRRHGDGAIAIEKMPLSDAFSVVIIDQGNPRAVASMSGTLVAEGAASQSGRIIGGQAAGGGRMVRITLAGPFDPATLGASLGIRGAGVRTALYPIGDRGALAGFFDRCRATLAARWQIDAMALARVAKLADPISPETWLGGEDYPQLESRAEPIGPAVVLIAIGADGRVAECRVVEASGVPYFDEASCQAIRRKGRYRPARDSEGKAVPSWVTRMLVWYPPRA